MDKLVCSICGFTSNQKRFKFNEINKHFDDAKEIWCPTNKCKENNKRIVPKGCICNYWYEYGGWCTIEKLKIIDIRYIKSFQKAKQLRVVGLNMLQERK